MLLPPTPFGLLALLTLPLVNMTPAANAAPADTITTTSPVTMLLEINPTPAAPRNSEGDLIRLRDGRLALVYTKFSGGSADHSSASLALRTSADNGHTWSADKTLVKNEGGRNVMSVSLRPSADGGILLFYLKKDTPHTSCAMHVRRSYDDLATLSEPTTVTTLAGYHVVNNDRVLRLASGRLLVPSALHTDPASTATETQFNAKGALVCYYSDDDGRTWHKDQMPVPTMAQRTVTFQEPGVVQLTDGRIMMYIRTDKGCQYASWSRDEGETWTAPAPTALKSPLSPATIERIPGTNTLVAIWNDHSGRWPFDPKNRTPLCLATSTDDAATWSHSQMLEPDPAGWFCYTSITFDPPSPSSSSASDEPPAILLTYCAGHGRANGLNRLKVSRLN